MNCDAPDAHLENVCLFSDVQAENLEIRNVITVHVNIPKLD
jgi:hypothetical protein